MLKPVSFLLSVTHFISVCSAASSGELAAYQAVVRRVGLVKSAMLASIRTSWEQGTAAEAILEFETPQYSVFGDMPFKFGGVRPTRALQLALSAVVRQSPDGRLSQNINDGLDGASLDGASIGPVVLLGALTDASRKEFWQNAASAQLRYLIETAPRTSTGAISHRHTSAQYWADGVYMGFPFLAMYGALNNDQNLLQLAYDNCRLYRDALLQPGPKGSIWAHIYSDDSKMFEDQGLWATGNAWAAKGMLQVLAAVIKSDLAPQMASQVEDLIAWIKEILDGTFSTTGEDNLIPNYIAGKDASASFGDAAASAALVGVAYRCATLFPSDFGSYYTDTAAKIRDAVIGGIDDMGLLSPVVDPLVWDRKGLLSTEAQAFGLMMLAAWREWIAKCRTDGQAV